MSTRAPSRTTGKLELDPATVKKARSLAGKVGRPIVNVAKKHTTVSVERATLRLAGLGRRRPRRHPLGQPARRRRPRRRRPRARRRRCRSGTRCSAARPTTSPCSPRRRRPGRSRFRLPEGRDATRARTASRKAVGAGVRRIDAAPPRARAADRQGRRRPRDAVDLPDRGHRRHLRGHPAGPGGRPRGRRRDRGDPLDRPVAARLRARGRHPRGLRRHLRHPGELPADAGRARRDQPGARPLRPADQLRLRPVHAGDRHPGRPRAARHDAQRLDVRDPLPRHQPDPHLRRPALQPPGPRPRRDHHQHRRGQLPHHRRRGRGRAHGHHQPAAQRVLRQGGRPRGLAARPRPRVRDRPRRARLVPPRARPRDAGPRPVPGRAAEVDAADPAHDRRRLPRLPARRVLQPGRRADRPGHPAGRDDDRGRGHAVALRPRPGAAERPLRHERRRQPARGLPPGPRRLHRAARPPGAGGVDRPARADPRPRATACSTRSPTAPSA